MAQLGYVVIAAWKNKSPNGSPHFVTVSPSIFMEVFNEYDFPEVAHVGGGKNMRLPLLDAFDADTNMADEIYFYCNLKQEFVWKDWKDIL